MQGSVEPRDCYKADMNTLITLIAVVRSIISLHQTHPIDLLPESEMVDGRPVITRALHSDDDDVEFEFRKRN